MAPASEALLDPLQECRTERISDFRDATDERPARCS
jgi:hypothetical protein